MRIYIVPIVGVTIPIHGGITARHPKYIDALGYGDVITIPYGSENIALVGVRDITPTDHAALAANADVIAIPEDLDANLTQGQATAAINFYDSLNIPSGWINTTRTVRQIVKVTAGIFAFNQRWSGRTGGNSPFKEGLSLDTRFNQLGPAVRGRVQDIFADLGVDTSGLSNQSTIREILTEFGEQMATRPFSVFRENI